MSDVLVGPRPLVVPVGPEQGGDIPPVGVEMTCAAFGEACAAYFGARVRLAAETSYTRAFRVPEGK